MEERNKVVETYVVCEITEEGRKYFKVHMTADGGYFSERPVIGLRSISQSEFERLQNNMKPTW